MKNADRSAIDQAVGKLAILACHEYQRRRDMSLPPAGEAWTKIKLPDIKDEVYIHLIIDTERP